MSDHSRPIRALTGTPTLPKDLTVGQLFRLDDTSYPATVAGEPIVRPSDVEVPVQEFDRPVILDPATPVEVLA